MRRWTARDRGFRTLPARRLPCLPPPSSSSGRRDRKHFRAHLHQHRQNQSQQKMTIATPNQNKYQRNLLFFSNLCFLDIMDLAILSTVSAFNFLESRDFYPEYSQPSLQSLDIELTMISSLTAHSGKANTVNPSSKAQSGVVIIPSFVTA